MSNVLVKLICKYECLHVTGPELSKLFSRISLNSRAWFSSKNTVCKCK